MPNVTNPKWQASMLPAYFLSLRLNVGFDTLLPSQYVSK